MGEVSGQLQTLPLLDLLAAQGASAGLELDQLVVYRCSVVRPHSDGPSGSDTTPPTAPYAAHPQQPALPGRPGRTDPTVCVSCRSSNSLPFRPDGTPLYRACLHSDHRSPALST